MSRDMTKTTKWHVRPAKAQISLGIRPVWSESSLSALRKLESLATHWAPTKTLIRLGGYPGWSESSLGAHAILFVLSWGGSNKNYCFKDLESDKHIFFPDENFITAESLNDIKCLVSMAQSQITRSTSAVWLGSMEWTEAIKNERVYGCTVCLGYSAPPFWFDKGYCFYRRS